jgi:hypothetical protein
MVVVKLNETVTAASIGNAVGVGAGLTRWRRRTVAEPVAYLYASIAGPVVLHRLEQIGVAKPLFSEKVVDDDLESANKWPNAHSMTPLYTKPQWQGLTDDDVHELTKDVIAFRSDVVKFIREAEAKLREKNT